MRQIIEDQKIDIIPYLDLLESIEVELELIQKTSKNKEEIEKRLENLRENKTPYLDHLRSIKFGLTASKKVEAMKLAVKDRQIKIPLDSVRSVILKIFFHREIIFSLKELAGNLWVGRDMKLIQSELRRQNITTSGLSYLESFEKSIEIYLILKSMQTKTEKIVPGVKKIFLPTKENKIF